MRHNIPVLDRSKLACASNLEKGAYTIWQNGEGTPDILLVASGSEVAIALDAAESLSISSNVRVVSMPSWELFDRQDEAYRAATIPQDARVKIAIEAGVSMGWEKYIGSDGEVLAIDHAIGDDVNEGVDLGLLGQVAWLRGQLDEAERFAWQALAIHKRSRDWRNELNAATTLVTLREVARERGQRWRAKFYFFRSQLAKRGLF